MITQIIITYVQIIVKQICRIIMLKVKILSFISNMLFALHKRN